MNIRKVRRKCSVRGCKNTDCFAISKVHEVGNSIIICSDCLKDGLEAVSGYVPEKKNPYTEPPALFYNKPVMPESDEQVEFAETAEAASDEAQSHETTEEQQENNSKNEGFVCPECGKVCAAKAGLARHMATHIGDKEGE